MSSSERKHELAEFVHSFSKLRILVVGDVMLDRYVWGSADRISPEAPVPVVRVHREESTPGGAANVARNLLSLGAHVHLTGIVGCDGAAADLRGALQADQVDELDLIEDAERPTTRKTRVIAGTQQIVRFDSEDGAAVSGKTLRALLRAIEPALARVQAVIVSDYNKGVVGTGLMKPLRRMAAQARVPIIVDPKVRNVAAYRGVDLMTPNHHEAGEVLGIRLPNEDGPVEAAGLKILKKLDLNCLIITRAAKGMSIFPKGKKPTHIPTVARKVFDDTGAGDAVIAATTLARVAGASWEQSAAIANYAGGVVVGKVGTGTVSARELIRVIGRVNSV